MASPQKRRRNQFKVKVYQTGLATKIFERDKYRCMYCGCDVVSSSMIWKIVDIRQNYLYKQHQNNKISGKKYLKESSSYFVFNKIYKEIHQKLATIDHVIPIALGGTDDETNLVTACFICNC